MTGRTHDLAGFSLLLTAFVVVPPAQATIGTLIVAILANQIGALFPDLDQAASNAWDRFPAGRYFGRVFSPFMGGHRHITHSLLGLLLFGYLTNKVLLYAQSFLLVNMEIVWLSFMIGYVSHLITDSLTERGLPLLWPIRFTFGIPPVEVLRITTGGWVEKLLIFPGLILLDFYLVYTYYDAFVYFFKSALVR